MENIVLSKAMLSLFILTTRERDKLYPSQKVNAHEDKNENIRLESNSSLEEEFQWFKKEFDVIYLQSVFPFFLTCDTDEEVYEAAYILYIDYLYQHYKECPVEFSVFRQWFMDVQYFHAPSWAWEAHADIYESMRMFHHGERLMKYAYLKKEAIERCTNPLVPLSEQKKVVDDIIACFNWRYKLEVQNFNIALILTNLDAEAFISNISFQRMELNGVYTHIDNVHYCMSYDHEFYPGWVEQYKEMKKVEEESSSVEEIDSDVVNESPQEGNQTASTSNNIDDTDKEIASINRYAKHYWILRKHFLQHDIEVSMYREDKDDGILLLDDEMEMSLTFDDGKFFRETVEEVYNLDAIAHEILKVRRQHDEERQKIDEKAKGHLYNFLQPRQIESFEKDHLFVVTGIKYAYILHKETLFNNVIRIEKDNPENKRTMCITPKNIYISEYDVMATIVLLINSGKEDILNSIGNLFPFSEKDEHILKNAMQIA